MTIWTCKGPLVALSLVFLSACEGIEGFEGLGGTPAQPLTQAKMANGAVTLVAPVGFCIDKRSLEPRFALMAPCDALGAPDAALGAPPSLMTVSLSSSPAGAALPAPEETARAASLVRVERARQTANDVIFRAQGPTPLEEMSPVQWRGTSRIGPLVAGIALYGPPDGRAISNEGRDIMFSLIQRSNALTNAIPLNSPATRSNANSFE